MFFIHDICSSIVPGISHCSRIFSLPSCFALAFEFEIAFLHSVLMIPRGVSVVALVPVPLGLGDKTIEVTKIDKKVGRKI